MPASLSNDLRKRIITAKLSGDAEEKIALEKSVSKSTITKLWSLYRSTGSYFPCPNPCGRKPSLSPEQLQQIIQAIRQQPDITLRELKEKYALSLSINALSVIIRGKLGFRYKKNAARQRTKS